MTPYDWRETGRDPESKGSDPGFIMITGQIPAATRRCSVTQFERIVSENTPEIKTVILRPGARFIYPDDQNIRRYRYPNQSEGYNPEKSVSYGEYARKYGKKN